MRLMGWRGGRCLGRRWSLGKIAVGVISPMSSNHVDSGSLPSTNVVDPLSRQARVVSVSLQCILSAIF